MLKAPTGVGVSPLISLRPLRTRLLRAIAVGIADPKLIVQTCVNALRNADWLTAERAQGYSRVLLFVNLAAVVAWAALSRGGLESTRQAARYRLYQLLCRIEAGALRSPQSGYNVASHLATQQAVFGGAPLGYTAFFYPPLFVLICLPLALVPYFPALAAWSLSLALPAGGRFARSLAMPQRD